MPAPLLRAIEARSASRLLTGHIEFSLTDPDSRAANKKSARFYSWQCAGDRWLVVNRGDTDGVVAREMNGEPSRATYAGPMSALTWEGEVWTHAEHSPDGYDYGREAAGMFDLFDLRQLGIYPGLPPRNLEEVLSHADSVVFDTRTDDGLEVVTAKINRSGEFRWWIDPAKDWSATRSAVYFNGAMINETFYEVRNVDGVWFPVRIEQFDRTRPQAEPKFVLEVVHAAFNQPEHPLELTPADIGIEVGTRMRRGDQTGRQPGRVYDGQGLTSVADYEARVASGELRPGPAISRERARLRARSGNRAIEYDPNSGGIAPPPVASSPARQETLWERYTREFVSRYSLASEQSAKGWAICRECQRSAQQYYARHAVEFRGALDAIAKPRATVSAARLLQPSVRLGMLLAPVHQIFQRELVPKLDRLPTRAQRRAARAGD